MNTAFVAPRQTVSLSLFHRNRLWLTYMALGCLLLSLYALPLPFKFSALLILTLNTLAVAAVITGIRMHRPAPVWRLVLLGQGSMLFGDLLYTQEVYLGWIQGFQEIRLGIYYLATLCFIACYWALAWQHRRLINTDVLIDGLVTSLGLGVFASVFHILPYMNAPQGWVIQLETTLLPAVMLLLIIPIAILLMTPLGNRWSIRFVFLALGCYLVGETFYNYLAVNQLLEHVERNFDSLRLFFTLSDFFYSACYLLVGAALLHPSQADQAVPALAPKGTMTRFGRTALSMVILIIPFVFLVNFILYRQLHDIVSLMITGAFALLVIWRYNHMTSQLEMQNIRLQHQQEDLFRLAHTDPLTGLPNRFFLYQHLQAVLAHSEHQCLTGAVLMVDLNNFKLVNDYFGHDAGDQALMAIAGQFNRIKRTDDVVVRWGGDEFVFILENVNNAENALAFARRLFREVCYPIHHAGCSVEVTVSVGVCLFPAPTSDMDSLLKWSDRALYQAKKIQGDKIMLYKPAA